LTPLGRYSETSFLIRSSYTSAVGQCTAVKTTTRTLLPSNSESEWDWPSTPGKRKSGAEEPIAKGSGTLSFRYEGTTNAGTDDGMTEHNINATKTPNVITFGQIEFRGFFIGPSLLTCAHTVERSSASSYHAAVLKSCWIESS